MIRLLKSKSIQMESIIAIYQTYSIHRQLLPSKLYGGLSDPDQKTEILEMVRLLKSKRIHPESIIAIYQTYTIHKTNKDIRHQGQLLPSKLHGGPSDPDQKSEILEMIRLLKSKNILLKSIIAVYQTYPIHRQLLRSKLHCGGPSDQRRLGLLGQIAVNDNEKVKVKPKCKFLNAQP